MLRKLVRYAAIVSGVSLITGGLNFLVNTFGMVKAPKAAYGDYHTYMLIYGIGQSVFVQGVNHAVQKFGSHDEERRRDFASLSYWLFLILCAVFGVAGLVVGKFHNWNFALGLFGVPWMVLWFWSIYIARSRLEAHREARLMTVASLGNTVLTFLFLTFTQYRDAMIYGDFAALIVCGLMGMYCIPRDSGLSTRELLKRRPPWTFTKEWTHFSAPLWLSGQIFTAASTLSGIYTAVDFGATTMAAFGTTRQLFQLVNKPMEILTYAALPGMVQAEENRGKLYCDVTRLCSIAFPFIGMCVLSGIPLFLRILGLNEKYGECVGLMVILVLQLPTVGIQSVITPFAVAEGRTRLSLGAYITQLVVGLGTIGFLGKLWGLHGVLISNALATAANGVFYIWAMRKDHRAEMRVAVRTWLCTNLACALGIAPIVYFEKAEWGFLAGIPAVLLYLATIFATRMVAPAELQQALAAVAGRFRRKKPAAQPATASSGEAGPSAPG